MAFRKYIRECYTVALSFIIRIKCLFISIGRNMCLLAFTSATWFLIIILCVLIGLFVLTESRHVNDELYDAKEPDGPVPLPVIGSLHLLAGYRVPYEAFRRLGDIYGDVFRIKLGSVPCVVVNGLDNIREVLMAKGDHFDGRPNFMRYNLIFNGDKRNCEYLPL